MATPQTRAIDPGHWTTPLARAVPLALLGVWITFSADHSPRLGLLAFGTFAVASGVVLGWAALRAMRAGSHFLLAAVQAAVTLIAGSIGLGAHAAGPGFLLALLGCWAAITGSLELSLGIRARGKHPAARDWLFTGILTALLAVSILAVPAGYSEEYVGPDGVSRVLSSSIVIIGVLGAYGVIAAVHLVIAGLSLKWAPAFPLQDGSAS